ncbi:MAG: adenylate/guanylate cyclase domain-containing protein [Leptospiraceae bacterium]
MSFESEISPDEDSAVCVNQLRQQLARKEREFQVIHELSSEINTTLDPDRIFKVSMDGLDQAFDFHHSLILLTDEAGKNLEVVASHGYPDPGLGATLPVGMGVIGVAAKRKKLLRSVAITYQSLYARMTMMGKADQVKNRSPMPGLENAASQMAIPLIVQDALIGIYAVESPAVGAFDSLDEQLLSIIGSMVGAAIANARTYRDVEDLSRNLEQKVQRRTEELNSLNTLTRTVNRSHQLETIVRDTAQYMVRHLAVRKMFLFLLNSEENEIRGMAGYLETLSDEQQDLLKNFRARVEPELGTLYRTIQRKRTVYLDLTRIKQARSAADRFVIEQIGLSSVIQIPVMVSGRVLGVACMDPGGFRMDRAALRKLESVVAQIAGAADNAYLLEQVSAQKQDALRERADSEILAEVARRANEARSSEEILQLMAEHVLGHCAVNTISLRLVDPTGELLETHSVIEDGIRTSLDDLPAEIRSIPLKYESGSLYQVFSRNRKMYLPRIRPSFVQNSPVDQTIHAHHGFEWFLNVPLSIQGSVIGIFSFAGKKANLPDFRARLLMERMVAQVAGAVHSKQLLLQVQEERNIATRLQEETEGLNQLLKRIASIEDIQELMNVVQKYVAKAYDIHYYSLYSMDPENQQVVPTALNIPEWISGDDLEHIRTTPVPLNVRFGALSVAYRRVPNYTYYRSLRPSIASDIERFIIEKYRMNNLVVYPLMNNNEPIAFLNFMTHTEGGLNREQLNQLSILSDQISGIIRMNGLLREIKEEGRKTEQARAETQALATLSRHANESTNLESICHALFTYLEDTLSLTNFCLFMVDQPRSEIYVVAGAGAGWSTHIQEWTRDLRIKLEPESGTLYSTYSRQKPMYLRRIPGNMDSAVDLTIVEKFNLDSILQVPLVIQGNTIGILACEPSRRLRPEDIQSVERFCNQIAGAMRTMALLQITQEAREEAVVAKEEAEQARAESDALLDNVLPAAAARELKETGRVEPIYFDSVSVLFTDFVGFTRAAANLTPAELIQELDGCFSQFDEVSRRNNLEKLKTIGDAYMCAGGLPEPGNSHPVDICLAALELRAFMQQMAEVKQQLGFQFWQIRIGIHTGPVTAGIIGQNKFAYDIWGDTVNVASRMESSGSPGMINISGSTYSLVKNLFECEHRGKVEAKGKGEMDMYFLHRIKPELSADEEGLLPNAMFEMARTDLDRDEIHSLKQGPSETPGFRSSESYSEGATDEIAHSATNCGFQTSLNQSDNSVESGQCISDRKQSIRKKPAGARPLSEIDADREGW